MRRSCYLYPQRVLRGLLILLVALLSGCGQTQQPDPSSTNQSSSGWQGTDLGETPAPTFQLHDQHGQVISLAQLKGMPVIVTFLYTHCPNYCPLIASTIHLALTRLGPAAQQVAIVAVSADPSGDTPASVATFSQEHGLVGYRNWHYLLGTRGQLSPIWAAYHVAGVPPHQKMMSLSAMQHSAVVYVLDQQGRERVLLDGGTFTPAQLATDLHLLLVGHP
jgi:protein SCO1/2